MKIKAISELNRVYKSIISIWDYNSEDTLFIDVYNKMHALTPEVKREMQELAADFIKYPDYTFLVHNIMDIQSLFSKTHKHQFIFHHANSLKNYIDLTIEAKTPNEKITIKKDVRGYYFRELKAYFNPQAQFKNFIYDKEFTTIDFIGTQAQLAGIFRQINTNKDLIKSNWKSVVTFISNNFTVKGKEPNRNTIESYLTGKKTISKKNEIEIKI